jgi:hypothetical protein
MHICIIPPRRCSKGASEVHKRERRHDEVRESHRIEACGGADRSFEVPLQGGDSFLRSCHFPLSRLHSKPRCKFPVGEGANGSSTPIPGGSSFSRNGHCSHGSG